MNMPFCKFWLQRYLQAVCDSFFNWKEICTKRGLRNLWMRSRRQAERALWLIVCIVALLVSNFICWKRSFTHCSNFWDWLLRFAQKLSSSSYNSVN